ncbi:MAG: hypothetical protein JW839_16145 [Candidatus Lokiarchaeota archaeon]|nr:hypothetical protein [Candidatus Lokiarchaeota archaeon]
MGWFDFLKKNKNRQGEDQENKPASNEDVDQAERAKSALKLDAGAEATMQREAILLQILDGLYDNPMKFLMQKRAKTEILKHLNAFLDSRPAAKDFWSNEGKGITSVVSDLLDEADKFAIERGMRTSPQRQSLIINIVMLGGVLGLFIVMYSIPDENVRNVMTQALLFVMCAMCCVPQFLQRYLNSRQMKFQAAHGADFTKTVTSKLEVVHDMVQYLLTDIRETLLVAGNDVTNIRFQLWNSDYKDIKVLDSKVVPGMAKTVYIVRFMKDVEDEEDSGPEMPVSTGPDSDVDFETDPASSAADSDDVDAEDDAENGLPGSDPREKKYP